MTTAISVKPDLPVGEDWCLHVGVWSDPDRQVLRGFASSFDAWAFAIAHGLDDPAAMIPAKFRQGFNKPKTGIVNTGQLSLLDRVEDEP